MLQVTVLDEEAETLKRVVLLGSAILARAAMITGKTRPPIVKRESYL